MKQTLVVSDFFLWSFCLWWLIYLWLCGKDWSDIHSIFSKNKASAVLIMRTSSDGESCMNIRKVGTKETPVWYKGHYCLMS